MGMVAHYLLLVAGMILQVVALEWCRGGVGGPSVFSLMFLQTPLMPLGFCFLNVHIQKSIWNLKLAPWKGKTSTVKPPICGFHLSFRGVVDWLDFSTGWARRWPNING